MTAIREFQLALPRVDGLPGQRDALRVRGDATLWVAKALEEKGLAGYEPSTLACLLGALIHLPSGVFFDIGSNIGVFSLLASAVSDWRVVAFEPGADLAAAQRSIAADNGLEPTIEELALGDKDGVATLYMSEVSDASNSLRQGFRTAKSTEEVEVVTLSSYCERSDIQPSLLKVDTESTEPAVFEGGLELIRDCRPWIICEVLAGRVEADLTRLLEPLGYSWFQITNESPLVPRKEIFGDRSHTFNNWLFTPSPPGDKFWTRVARARRAIDKCLPARREPDPADADAAAKSSWFRKLRGK